MRIEKNVPVPAPAPVQRRQYPYADMEVGDSVFIPYEGSTQNSTEAAYARVYGSRHSKRFTVRKVEGGLRVWRTA